MNAVFSTFLNLPPQLRVISLIAGGASLSLIAYALFAGFGSGFFWILIVGLVIAAMVVALYRVWLKWSEKRKAKPLEQGLVDNSAAAPSSVSDPARRANLDSLRKDFEEGVAKFKAAGKDLYGLPWYLLVGEPGSGKTEAVRHCNVGFPPGLQDPQQGVGGTLNMNWWFTNQAIILDTAGRLMFEEVQAGTTSEWKELLKLLNTARARCPINGMLLVIPADSLLKDTADQIEKKAGRIAQQLDGIQRTLDIRFPVFIIITKSDIITGFREFFQELNDPQLQHQMLGWSNSSGIDDAFRPELVESHLQGVRERLHRRRLTLLMEPPQSDTPSRRTDMVDGLYAFPDELLRIAPRLRRYLEMIFVAGEWSPKPLFLRGIYFTSSLQEGQELDAGLAELLGVDVDSLPGESSTRKDKAYFLRDLFVEKIFPERGLVSRSTNASKHHRRNKLIVLGSGVGAAVLFLLLTMWFGMRFNASIGDHERWWSSLAQHLESRAMPERLVEFDQHADAVEYVTSELSLDGTSTTYTGVIERSTELSSADLEIPGIFRAIGWFKGWFGGEDLSDKPVRAHASLVGKVMLEPLVKQMHDEMSHATARPWSDESSRVLVQLLRMARLAADGTAASDAPEVDPLFRYLLAPQYIEAYERDAQLLQQAVNRAYETSEVSVRPLAPQAHQQTLRNALTLGIERWSQQLAEGSGRYGSNVAELKSLRQSLARLEEAERELWALKQESVESSSQFERFKSQWATRYEAVEQEVQSIEASIDALGVQPGDSMNQFLQQQERLLASLQDEYRAMRGELPEEIDPDAAPATPSMTLVHEAVSKLEATWASVENNLLAEWEELNRAVARFDEGYFQIVDLNGEPRRLFQRRGDMYRTVNEQLVSAAEPGVLAQFAASLSERERGWKAATDRLGALTPLGGIANEQFSEANAVSRTALEAARRKQRQDLYASVLTNPPHSPEEVAIMIAEAAGEADPKPWPNIPLAQIELGETLDPRFDYTVAGRIVGQWRQLADQLDRGDSAGSGLLDASLLRADMNRKRAAFDGYMQLYCEYWSRDVFLQASDFSFESWPAFLAALHSVRVSTVNAGLSRLSQHVREAYDQFSDNSCWPANFRTQLLAQHDELSRSDNDRRHDETRGRWRALPEDPISARDTLLRAMEDDFDYLPFNYRDDAFGLDYWNALYREGLRVLARAANERAGAARRALTEDRFRTFPLCQNCTGVMDLQTLREAQNLLGELGAVQSAPGRDLAAWRDMPTLRECFVQLRGGDQAANLDRSGLTALRMVTETLAGVNTYAVRPLGADRNIAAIQLLGNVRIRVDGQRIGTWSRIGSGSDVAWGTADGRDVSVPVTAEQLVFEFRLSANEDRGMYVATLPTTWGLIGALAQSSAGSARAIPADPNEPQHTRWMVPLRAAPVDGPGEPTTVWVEIELEKPLPGLDQWPTADRWPVRALASN